MVKIAICDDNVIFLNKFEKLLKDNFFKFNYEIQIDKYTKGKELIKKVELNKFSYDIVILDVDMPEMNGFYVAENLRKINNNFVLIFTTNMSSEAPKGYKYNAFRYILKDKLEGELLEAVREIVKKDCIILSSGKKIEFKVNVSGIYELREIEEKDVVQLYKNNRKTFLEKLNKSETLELLQYNLKYYQRLINRDHFIIVSRSHLINLDNVDTLKGDFFTLKNGRSVCIGSKEPICNEIKLKYAKYKRERI